MDWGMKLPPWDLPELEHVSVSEPNTGSSSAAAAASASSSGDGLQRQMGGLDFDLKLGRLGDFGSSSSKWKDPPRPSTTPAAAAASPSKRARTPSNGSGNVACLVDGCRSDLSGCREYHRRHKVCEAHSKTPTVLVGGLEQRFCQQCSRFHLLVEFDEVKRSCRKRLDGHNRRRRKPQPEPINSGSLPFNLQGPRFLSYSHLYPTSTTDPSWDRMIKSEDMPSAIRPPHCVERRLPYTNSNSRGFRDGKQFPFLQDDDAPISGRILDTSACQPLRNTISFSGNNSNGGKMFSNGLSHVLDSDCALSLLSSPTQTSSVNLSHILPVDRIPIAQPLAQGLQQHYGDLGGYSLSQPSNNVSTTGFSCSGMSDEHVSTVLVSNDTDAELQCPSFFHLAGGSSSDGPSNVLPSHGNGYSVYSCHTSGKSGHI